jgi:hypothetical protein
MDLDPKLDPKLDPNSPDPHDFGPPGSMDPESDPSIIMKNGKTNLDSYYFVTLFDFLS